MRSNTVLTAPPTYASHPAAGSVSLTPAIVTSLAELTLTVGGFDDTTFAIETFEWRVGSAVGRDDLLEAQMVRATLTDTGLQNESALPAAPVARRCQAARSSCPTSLRVPAKS